MKLFHEASVLLDTFDSECLRLSTDGIDELVVRESSLCELPLDLGGVCIRISDPVHHNDSVSLPEKVTVLFIGWWENA